jgi:hypothetical protein
MERAVEEAGAAPVDISPWAALSALRKLEVVGIPAAPVGGPHTLFSSLQELKVCSTPWHAYWVQQLQGAAQLTHLHIDYCNSSRPLSPASSPAAAGTPGIQGVGSPAAAASTTAS